MVIYSLKIYRLSNFSWILGETKHESFLFFFFLGEGIFKEKHSQNCEENQGVKVTRIYIRKNVYNILRD